MISNTISISAAVEGAVREAALDPWWRLVEWLPSASRIPSFLLKSLSVESDHSGTSQH